MSLEADHRRQFGWRAWPSVLAELPSIHGQSIIDLGCGMGDVAAELSRRGAKVIGFDGNDELLTQARKRHTNVEFRACDLHTFRSVDPCHGVWCSFTAAYFPSLTERLRSWTSSLRPGGWIALTEVDDLFGHEPLGPRAQALFGAYARDALQAKRYDFHMGHKLGAALLEAGFEIQQTMSLVDPELAFEGAAQPEVLEAWRARFDRMALLQAFCGAEFGAVRDEFLSCLADPGHRATSRVLCCIARKP